MNNLPKSAGSSGAGTVVAQLGARRHYAVPLAFHAQGKLQSFCTELLVQSPLMQSAIRRMGHLTGLAALSRLADRQAAIALPKQRVRTFPLFGLRYKWQGQRARSAQARTANWLWGGQKFSELCTDALDDQTTSVYAFTSAARELFEAAKARGAACWLDHATAPRAFEVGLIQEEAGRFPGWSVRSVEDPLTDDYLARQREELHLADAIVCGSTFAKRAIMAEGVAGGRIRVVPLGVADHMYATAGARGHRAPGALRVLYAGGDGLRKGLPYLAMALKRLGSSRVEARAAGELELSPLAHRELASYMQLLGPVARYEMPALFRWADVLVLPSISDTFGMVILEAMAAGVPVIASENTAAPDLVREGIDGYVVPIRDSDSIAERLERLAVDPGLLEEMSRKARSRAAEFSVGHYGGRLVSALEP